MDKTKETKFAEWNAETQKNFKRGQVTILNIQHDDWCAVFTVGSVCTCDPTRVLKSSDGRELCRAGGLGSYSLAQFLEAYK